MQAEKVGNATVLANIVRLVSEAQRTRAPIQRLADQAASWFVPAVIAVAVLTFAVWALWGPEPRIAHAFVNAVAVLIIACPCALGLATPMSIMVGTGRGATEGVLFRNAEALETLAKADTLVIDKTGTLTQGKPKLVTVEAVNGQEKKDLLRWAASLEQGSEHPLAAAILAGAQEQGIALASPEKFQAITGKGASGSLHGKKIVIGNQKLLEEQQIDLSSFLARASELQAQGQTVMFVAVENLLAGLLGVVDPLKPSTPEAIRLLRQEKLHVVMLTGDNRQTAQAVANWCV